jgi:serine/threonine-protein kinase
MAIVDRPADDGALLQLAAALDSGVEIDWPAAESTASAPDEQAVVSQLRVVAAVAEASRRLHAAQTAAEGAPPPTEWGPLAIREEIGRGRFGTVYRAWDPALERDVALKILHEVAASEAILREGRMLARVRHPNVVTVYGVDRFDGRVGLWMEFVSGRSLKDVVARQGPMGPREAALVAIDVCRAAAAVHQAGLLHRDIKVHNVMCEAGGRVVLMDLGAGESRHAAPHNNAGTPLYLAPELFDGEPASVRSDVYSIGVLLYYLLTLRYPVEGETAAMVAAAHARLSSIALADRRPAVPPGFVRVVDRALERDPAQRFESVGAMQNALSAALAFDIGSSPPMARLAFESGRAAAAVAVLPFANLGPDTDIEYFCSGLAEEVLIGLGKVDGLRVASRSSAIRARDECHDARSICRQLNVDALVEGTVRKAGDRLRITAQLVSAHDGCHLWSEGYDRQLLDVLTVQEQIAVAVVDRLKVTLGDMPRRPLTRHHTANAEAYHDYLKGRDQWSRRYHGGLRTALKYFQKAIAGDGDYALAHAGLADAYSFLVLYSVARPRDAFRDASRAANRAFELAPDLPEAHTSLALIELGHHWNWHAADRLLRRALELDASQSLARIYLSWLLVLEGDARAATEEAREAQGRDPSSSLVQAGAAYALFLSRQYDAASEACKQSLRLDPNLIVAIYVLAMCRAQQGRLAEAIGHMERATAMASDAPFYLGLLGNFYARAGDRERVAEVVRKLEHPRDDRYVPPHAMAYVHAGLNDVDRAIACEAKAFDDGASPFNYYSPIIENLHADARHTAELRRMGAPI